MLWLSVWLYVHVLSSITDTPCPTWIQACFSYLYTSPVSCLSHKITIIIAALAIGTQSDTMHTYPGTDEQKSIGGPMKNASG